MNRLAAISLVSLAAFGLALGASPSVSAGAGPSECGRISVFDTAPRQQELYPAVLIAINGESPGPSNSDTFRVPPGTHVLTVAENIDSDQFAAVHKRQRSQSGRDRYQSLEVNVQPGVTYRLAAQFNLAARGSISDSRYWQPVVWSEKSEACR